MKMWYINPMETEYQRARRKQKEATTKANFEKKIGYTRKEVKKDEE